MRKTANKSLQLLPITETGVVGSIWVCQATICVLSLFLLLVQVAMLPRWQCFQSDNVAGRVIIGKSCKWSPADNFLTTCALFAMLNRIIGDYSSPGMFHLVVMTKPTKHTSREHYPQPLKQCIIYGTIGATRFKSTRVGQSMLNTRSILFGIIMEPD